MTMEELKTWPTVKLIKYLSKCDEFNWNMIIYELTCRMYVPFNEKGISFDDLLLSNGYIQEKKEKNKQK